MKFAMIESGTVPIEVSVDETMIRVRFKSGPKLATPVTRFSRLAGATRKERKTWRIVGQGGGIHWPEIDDDISVQGLFGDVRLAPSYVA